MSYGFLAAILLGSIFPLWWCFIIASGTASTIDAATLREAYPMVPDFVALAAKYDPIGKFHNPYLNTCLLTA
ncbi:hypothetical protein [Planotetraspora mira]|uniref:Uncharacterized protein n=1 Tax=Planotetraspora mira TaxID=58121 RepID=A0A8J3TTS9_9ACTN|nr:hypothetical protein [Planotetraspora mira]GII32993.1 hypothetical protein Pmi06nite_64350 [Planotetraspora mira]